MAYYKSNSIGVFALGLLAFISSVSAQTEWQGQINAGLLQTDNADRSSIDKESQTEGSIGLNLMLTTVETDYNINLNYSVRHTDYSYGDFSSDTVAEGSGFARWNIKTETLYWDLTHAQEYLTSDPSLTDTPNNREQRSTLTTGPTYHLTLSSVDTLDLSLMYTDIRMEETDQNDSQRGQATANWIHLFSSNLNVNIRVNHDDVSFPDVDGQDYTSELVAMGITAQRPWGSLNVEVGESTLEQDDGSEQKGEFYNLAVAVNKEYYRLTLDSTRELTDSTIGLGTLAAALGVISRDNSTVILDVVERNRTDLGADFDVMPGRFNLRFSAFYDDEDYKSTDNDLRRIGGSSVLAYQMWRSLSLEFGLDQTKTDYLDSTNRKDTTDTATVSLAYQINDDLTFDFRVMHEENESNLSASSYEVSSAEANIRYQLR